MDVTLFSLENRDSWPECKTTYDYENPDEKQPSVSDTYILFFKDRFGINMTTGTFWPELKAWQSDELRTMHDVFAYCCRKPLLAAAASAAGLQGTDTFDAEDVSQYRYLAKMKKLGHDVELVQPKPLVDIHAQDS